MFTSVAPVVQSVAIVYGSATAPAAPTSLAAAQADTGVTLTWTDNSANETGFKVYRDGALIHTTAANVTSYLDTGATTGTEHSWYVKAAGAADSAASNTATFTWYSPIQDAFSGAADTDITGRAADTINVAGRSWTSEQNGGGANRINTNGSGVAYNATTSGSPLAWYEVGTPDGKVTISGGLRSAAGASAFWAIVRYKDNDDFWVATWTSVVNGPVTLYECLAGSFTSKGSYNTGDVLGTGSLVLEATTADAFNVYINSTLRIGPVTDTTHNTETKAGFAVVDTGSTGATTHVTSFRWDRV